MQYALIFYDFQLILARMGEALCVSENFKVPKQFASWLLL